MHAAWQEHAAALLRELLLIRLDGRRVRARAPRGGERGAQRALRADPDPRPRRAPRGDHGRRRPSRASPAPASCSASRAPSMPHFEVLDSALVEAVALADLGQLLSPPTQPEIQHMRHWLCDQVRSQADGRGRRGRGSRRSTPTRPWPPTELDWDAAERQQLRPRPWSPPTTPTGSSRRARRRSPLLGYADAGDLVGQRLISIIPTALPPGPHRRLHPAPGQRALPAASAIG